MALRDLLECTTALTNIFFNDSWDDDFVIYHKVDLSEFKNTPCFEHHTPVQQIPTNLSCKAKTVVVKLNQDCYTLKLIIDTELRQKDLTRPVLLEWNVSVINENTEESRLLGGANNAPGGNFGDLSNELQIKLSEFEDFIINDSLIFKWTIRLMPGPEPEGFDEEETIPLDLSVVKPEESDIKNHLHAMLSQTQNQRNAMKSSRFQEAVVHIDKVVSECKDDDVETDSIGRRMDDVEKRVDKLRESFVEQRGDMERFMSDWEDAVKQDEGYKRDDGEAVTKRDSSKDTVLPPTRTACGHVLEKEILVEKAELEKKLQPLLLSTEEEFRKIKEEANANNAKIRELDYSRQKDAKAHDAKMKKIADSYTSKIKQLEKSQQKMLLMLQSMSQGPNNQSPQQPASDACSPQVPKPAPAPVPSNEPSIKPTEPNIKYSKSGQQTSTGPDTQHAELKSQGPSTQGPHQPKTDASSRQVLKTLRVPLPIIPTPEAEILGPNSVRQQKPSAGPSKQPTEPKAQVSKAPRAQLSLKEPYIQLPGPKDSNQKEKPY